MRQADFDYEKFLFIVVFQVEAQKERKEWRVYVLKVEELFRNSMA